MTIDLKIKNLILLLTLYNVMNYTMYHDGNEFMTLYFVTIIVHWGVYN